MRYRNIDPRRYLALTALLSVVVIIAICLLPHNRNLRFAVLTDWDVVKAGWIYERIHSDPTPIDIAFIGTSRTIFGVDSAKVEAVTRQRTGLDLHVVNFALPFPGRDLHWLIARELLKTRKVKLLVLEVDEDEPRDLHRAFGSLADVHDLIFAPMIINVSYFPNLIRLPRRQLSLFLRSTFPAIFDDEMTLDSASYRGAHWDDTWAEEGTPQAPIFPIRPRTTFPSAGELAHERAHETEVAAHKIQLPSSVAWLEHRANIYYLRKIAASARERDVALTFLYLPGYQGLDRPREAGVYQQLGPLWTPPTFLSKREMWYDVNHLNYNGAFSLATWLGNELSKTQTISHLMNIQPTSVSATSSR
jgi:hypothetical protein